MDSQHLTPAWSPHGQSPAPAEPGRPVALPNAGDLLAGRFRLLGVLGSGGSGIVWAAHDEKLGQRVAIKLIYPHLLNEMTAARLRREVTAARQPHPHAVTVYDLHEADGLGFLSMELVEGPTLRQRLQDRGRLDPPEVTAIGRQVAAALAHLHASGLVHRDVKPGNILLSRAGAGAARTSRSGLASGVNVLKPDPAGDHRPGETVVVKLCDLGLVRPLAAGSTLTESSMVVGTPAYMAPEQGIGADLTGRTDVYALGITLYECLTGQVPLQGESAVATLVQRQKTHVPRVRTLCPGCPPLLDRLLDRMLDPDPRRRPAAAEVERTLASGHLRFRLPVKQLVTLAAAAALVATGWLGWSWLRTPRTARVEAMGREVRGLDDRGTTTWSYQLENPVRQVEHADLDGDGREETLVATWPDAQPGVRTGELPLSELIAVTEDGKVAVQVRPEELVTSWKHRFPKRLQPQILPLDLDRDGAFEVVLNCRHRDFFPDQLLVYWPRWGRWDWVLDHSGAIYDLVLVPDPGKTLLRFVGVNNRFSMLLVMGEIQIEPPGQQLTWLKRQEPLMSPDYRISISGAPFSWSSYVPLAQPLEVSPPSQPGQLRVGSVGETRLTYQGTEVVSDRFGNPLPGPNTGRDLRLQRLEFFAELYRLGPFDVPADAASVRTVANQIAQRFAQLLAEPPYRALLALRLAQAFAHVGSLQDAEQTLAAAKADTELDDVAFRLAHLQALMGRVPQARSTLSRQIDRAATPRAVYDAPQLLFRLAIEQHDEAGLAACIDYLCRRDTVRADQPGLAAAMAARAHLWWDEATEADSNVRTWPYAPDGEAIACLARWRLGKSRPGDVGLMRQLIKDTPDGANEGRLGLAAAMLAAGLNADALATLDDLTRSLEPAARDDFGNHQLLQLGLAMRLRALVALGRQKAAHEAAASLRHRLTGGLLPARLCDEVLGGNVGSKR